MTQSQSANGVRGKSPDDSEVHGALGWESPGGAPALQIDYLRQRLDMDATQKAGNLASARTIETEQAHIPRDLVPSIQQKTNPRDSLRLSMMRTDQWLKANEGSAIRHSRSAGAVSGKPPDHSTVASKESPGQALAMQTDSRETQRDTAVISKIAQGEASISDAKYERHEDGDGTGHPKADGAIGINWFSSIVGV